MRPLLFLVLLLWCADLRASGRLAVIASPEVPNEGALLLSALSDSDGVELVEREEISKLLAERKAAAENSGQLASLLRANGLVFLEKTGGFLTTRVVDGQSGAVLEVSAVPLPVADKESWSRQKADEIAKLARKLPLAATGAVPISLYRINSATRDAVGEALEDSLNVLLANRLSSHAGVVLLERSKLQDAAAENSLTSEESDFWKSSWIVEGSVTASVSGYHLHIRFQPPGGVETRVLDIRGADLPAVIEETNAAIIGALGRQNTAWDGAAESARLVEEAKWAASNQMWDQAIAATEAAIALGDKGQDLLKWRWICYRNLALGTVSKNPGSAQNPSPARRAGAMARALQLCGELLAIPEAGRTGRRFPSLGGRDAVAVTPAEEATALLASSSRFLQGKGRKNSSEDLRELRAQTRALYDEIVRVAPALQLQPSSGKEVPVWKREGESRSREWASYGGGGFQFGVKRKFPHAQIERLQSGRLWEDSPEAYHAYIRKCLESDLPADPHFYQLAVSTIADLAGRSAFMFSHSEVAEWKDLAVALAREKDARLQIGAASIFCRIGLPMEAMKIFEQRREDVLTGKFPLEYLLTSFSTQPSLDTITARQGGGSLRDAVGSLVEFVIPLWKEGLAPSERAVESLAALPLSDRQLAKLLPVLREKPEVVHKFSRAINALAVRAGEKPPPVPEQSPLPNAPEKPIAAKEAVLKVDLGWAARNSDSAGKPGVIRWAIPDGGRVWMEVLYSTRDASRMRRQFVIVDLPTLQSHIVYRDGLNNGIGSSARKGPTFAVSGETIYFWDGRGISCVVGGQARSLDGPELKAPLLWLVRDHLYAADQDGVLVEYDLRASTANVIASTRRRPAVNLLDSERGLGSPQRVFQDQEGNLTVLFSGRTYRRGSDGQWLKMQASPEPRSLAQLAGSLENIWQDTGSGALRVASLLRDFSPHAVQTAAGKGPPMMQFAACRNGVLWCLQNSFGKETLQLVRLELEGEKLVRRTLDFSPELLAFYEPAGFGSPSADGFRLLPLDDGFALYAPETSVLWFLPSSEISTLP